MHTTHLLDFLATLGVMRTSLSPDDREIEAVDRYTLLLDRPVSALGKMTPGACEALVSAFGAAITLLVGDSELPTLEIRQGQLPPDLPQRIARAQASATSGPLRIDIDKRVLFASLIADKGELQGRYFLFTENLLRFLGSPLTELDSPLLAGDRPIFLIVGDSNASYIGQALTIIGETQFDDLPARSATFSEQFRIRIARYRHAAEEQLSWVGFQLQHLTPLHFLCERRGDGDPRLTSIIARQLFHSAVLYSANRASATERGYEATYASSDRTVSLHLLQDDMPTVDHRSLVRFALWPYESGYGFDRLTVLQNVIARELDDSHGQPNITIFSARLDNLLAEARWNYRTFIDRRIDQHFVQLQGAKDYVAETTKKVAEAVDSVTKGLTEALLATLGVIVAALLAALAKPQEEGHIVETTMRLYALYLIVQAVLRFGSVLHGIILLRRETTARLGDLRLVLGARNIATISKPLRWRWWQFGIWLAVTVALFIMLGVGVLRWVPRYVRSAALTPTPAPTIVVPTPRP